MPDAVELVKTIKRTALEAIEAAKPVHICFGTVVSVKPLQINVEQKLLLGEMQIILTRNVMNYKTSLSVNWETEKSTEEHSHEVTGETKDSGEPAHIHAFECNADSETLTHSHSISGRKEIIIQNGLVDGDEVILLRQQDGQKYIVWDKLQ